MYIKPTVEEIEFEAESLCLKASGGEKEYPTIEDETTNEYN